MYAEPQLHGVHRPPCSPNPTKSFENSRLDKISLYITAENMGTSVKKEMQTEPRDDAEARKREMPGRAEDGHGAGVRSGRVAP